MLDWPNTIHSIDPAQSVLWIVGSLDSIAIGLDTNGLATNGLVTNGLVTNGLVAKGF
jgi:hypothetical protein